MLFRATRAAATICPAPLLLALGRLIGRLYGRLDRRHRRIAEAQLNYVFGSCCPPPSYTSGHQPYRCSELACDVFGHVGEAVMEVLYLPRLKQPNPPLKVHAIGEDIVLGITNEGKGALALSGHIGCIELLAAYHVTQGVPLSVIGRKPNYPAFMEILDKLRHAYGVDTIWRDESGSLKKLLRAIKEKRFIAALIDQDTQLENGFAPFFDLEAATPITLLRLAIQNEVPVLSSFIVRTGPATHEIRTEQIEYDPQSPDAMREIVTVFNQRLEELIRAYPEQWLWWHRRWRRRPGIDYAKQPEQLISTTAYLEWLRDQRMQRESAAKPELSAEAKHTGV